MKPKHPATRKYLESGIFDALSTFGGLEQRIRELPTDKERGDAFEVFAEAYLATQKITQAKEIWPETQLPPTLIGRFNLGRRKGVGVDGLYETTGGEWFAYQVKFRTSENLTYNEVSSFFGITEAFDQRVLITNCNRLASQIDDRPNAFCIRGNDLARLEKTDLEAIVQWLKSTVVEIERKSPDPHQQEALDAILPALTANDRVSAIMACGTGKTLVTLWAAEQFGCKTVLILVPSLALIRQTLHEWLAETSWPKLAYLCVCSDPSVQKGSDDIVVRPSELDFPVSTDSSTVTEFLSKPTDGIKVVFSTYQSAPVVAGGMDSDFSFDLGIFDEAHKTAGRQGKKNSYALDNANLDIRKRLFVTATPRHYSPTKKTKEGDQAVLYSMDDPAVYGSLGTRYELSFAEAARRKIICDYKVIISAISQETVTNELLRRGEVIVEGDSVRARQVANQLAIKNAIVRYGIKKVFSFHARVKSAESFTSDRAEGINSIIPDIPAFHVNGKMNASDRESIMQEFAAASWGIVSNAKCLTEGVDVPAVDMVAFMSPKKSKVDIVQATGRAMRRPRDNSDKTVGYVFLPLYIEQAKGETEEEAISRLGFEELADVLNAMKEQDDVLVDILRELREERGRVGGYDDSRFREKVEVIGDLVGLDTLRDTITTCCVDRLGVTWDERMGELKAFKKKHDHCNVPRDYADNPKLGGWCTEQRTVYRRKQLSPKRVARLEAIGFDFHPIDTHWEEMFSALLEYRNQHDHCNVPKGYAENPQLGVWCRNQRTAYKNNKVDAKRVERLEGVGFQFDVSAARWEEMFSALLEYRNQHDHCNVPKGYAENPQLGGWCAEQRTVYRRKQLSPKRVARLEHIGFDFDRQAAQWEEMFSALLEYRNKHRHCKVPKRYAENPKLGEWCRKQRTAYKNNKLDAKRVARLEAIGFDFHPIDTHWEEMFSALLEYRNQHDHCNVPKGYAENPQLGVWCRNQRTAYKNNKLDAKRVERLEAIGFQWSLK